MVEYDTDNIEVAGFHPILHRNKIMTHAHIISPMSFQYHWDYFKCQQFLHILFGPDNLE